MNVYIWSDQWTPGSNTIAYYKFTLNANDDSGNGRNATNVGATFSSDGAYFSDYDKMITLPSMIIGTVFTISCWTKLTSNPTTEQEFEIYYDWSNPYRNLLFGLTATAIRGWTGNNGTTHNTTITSSVSDFTNWHNYILVKNGTTLKLYKDGALVSTGTSPYNVSIPGGSNTVTIGHNTSMAGAYQGVPGYLKDYIIENKVRTAEQVAGYYNQTKSLYGIS